MNWNELALGLSDNIKEICMDAKELEYELNHIIDLVSIDIFPPIENLLNISTLTEKILRKFLYLIKYDINDKKEIEEIEDKFTAIKVELKDYEKDIIKATIENNVRRLGIHLSIFRSFLYSFVYGTISETKHNLASGSIEEFRNQALNRIGITPLPKEIKELKFERRRREDEET